MRFSEWFREMLNKRQMKAATAAMYLGISDSAVSKWLCGIYIPRPAQCRKVAKLFHVSEEEVLRAAGHLSPTPQGGQGLETPEEFELEALMRAMPPEWKRALLALWPVAEAMAERVAEEREKYEAAAGPRGKA